MEFVDVVKTRTSIRGYSDKPVEEEKLRYVLDCARRAPSWANKQCWRFVVVREKDTIKELAKHCLFNRWIQTAPVVIVACADPSESGSHDDLPFYAVDVAIAVEHLILAATDVHLGTCWIGAFSEQKIKQQLEIPKRIRIITLIPLGYPSDKKGVIASITRALANGEKRKSLDEIVHYEHW
jgi:nitroreductase